MPSLPDSGSHHSSRAMDNHSMQVSWLAARLADAPADPIHTLTSGFTQDRDNLHNSLPRRGYVHEMHVLGCVTGQHARVMVLNGIGSRGRDGYRSAP